MTLCFATNNGHKIAEVRAAAGSGLSLITLDEELPETQPTLEGNARQKARYVFDRYSLSCFADDTGLEVDALGGVPGVHSARYAGPGRSSEANIDLLLRNLSGLSNRAAQFRAVFWLVTPKGEWAFEGTVRGQILQVRKGSGGFGYDPVFLPDGSVKTLAEMSMDEKNRISHRGIAVRKLAEFLRVGKAF
jgi:XTP/dITP diphosphohydrolase